MTQLLLKPEQTLSPSVAPPNPTPPSADHSRTPELDGVRAIAIWLVIVSHIFHGWAVPSGTFDRIPSFLMQLILHGWLGVDLFFVLSGFLITGILLDSRNKAHYFRNFYARRFLRIMPLYFVVVLISLIFYFRSWQYFVLSTFFAANLAHLFGVGVPHGPGALWSLAVEEHFYLLWPFLVYLLDRRRLAVLATLIVLLTPIARGLAAAHGMPVDAAIYVYSWFRFDGLALGALLAIWVRSPRANRANSLQLAAALVGLSLLVTVIGAPFGLMHEGPLGTALRFNQAAFVFAAMVLLTVVLKGTPWTHWLRTSFARTSGNLSYCLYLIHVSLGDAFQAVAQRLGLNLDAWGGMRTVLVRGAFILATSFALAMVSKKYLEEPFLRLKRHFEVGPTFNKRGVSSKTSSEQAGFPALL